MFILHGVRNPQKFSEGENCVREVTVSKLLERNVYGLLKALPVLTIVAPFLKWSYIYFRELKLKGGHGDWDAI